MVHQQLLRLVPADDVVWIQARDNYGSHCVAVRGDPWVIDEDLSAGLTRYWPRHVTPRWFAANLSDRTPNRVSDLISPRRWRENEIFRELKNAMPEHQLNIIMPPPARHRGWVLTRQRRDFSDAEVEMATALAPVLATLGLMYDRLEPWQATAHQ